MAALCFSVVTTRMTRAIVPTIKIFSGGAMRALMTFERTNGVSVDIEFRLASAHKKAIEDGAAFDVAILPRPELDELAEHGAIARACTADRPRRAGRGANARYRQRRGADASTPASAVICL